MDSAMGRSKRGQERVVEIVREHAPGLLALARKHSLCADDAHDAYQRALEILLKRIDTLETETTVSWLRTVVKHEAYAVRAQRQALVAREEPELDGAEAALPDDDERILRFDRLTRAAEALQRLKPHEVQAMLLKAEGHSYEEICSMTGWSYTKLNRCLSEGRRAFRDRYATIETGEECARWAPLLSAVADGEATAEDLLALRPHLRACPACRATLRTHHDAPSEAAALLPLGLVLAPAAAAVAHGPRLPGLPGFLTRAHEVVLSVSPAKMQAAVDAAWSGKAAALAASTVALAGGGVAVTSEILEHPLAAPPHAARPSVRARTVARHALPARSIAASGAPAPASPRPVPRPQPAPASTPAPRPRPVTTTPAVHRPPPAATEFSPEATPAPPAASSPSEFSAAPAPTPAPTPARATTASASPRAGAPSEFGP